MHGNGQQIAADIQALNATRREIGVVDVGGDVKRSDTVRLLAVVGLASGVVPKPDRSMRLKEEGSAAVSTVMNKDLLLA